MYGTIESAGNTNMTPHLKVSGGSVTATYYATTVNGHLTINTTDNHVVSADIVDNRDGSHTLNYIG